MTDGVNGDSQYVPTEDYFKVLFSCIVAALLLLVGTHIALARGASDIPPWVSVIAGVTPLVFYHLGYLGPRAKKGLSQTAIDSVYYFGFLITVAARGISAVAIAQSSGAIDNKPIVYQFGVGLFATGYAVIARMHLSSISKMLDEASPEAIIDKYIQRSRALVDNVEMAVVSISQVADKSSDLVTNIDALSASVLKKTEDAAQRAQVLATKSIMSAAKVFEEEMRSTMASSKQALQELRSLMSDASFIEERKQLLASLHATVETTSKLNQSLSEFNRATLASANAADATSSAQRRFGETLNELGGSVDALVGSDGGLQHASRQIVAASAGVAAGTVQLSESVALMSSVTQQLSEQAGSQLKLNKLLKKAESQLSSLAEVTERFGNILEQTQAATEASGRTVGELNKVAAALPLLSVRVGELSESLAATSNSSNGLIVTTSRLPEELSLTRGQLETTVSLVKQLATSSAEAAGVGGLIQSDLKNILAQTEAARRMLESSEKLSLTLQSIESFIASLPGSIKGIEHSLAESAGVIKASVETSAKLLEADAHRSAAAATLLTTSLVDVAQTIVNRTREHQGMTQ
jgi:ABC-type transporter Mla subunit MlaD